MTGQVLRIPLRARLTTKCNYPLRPKYKPAAGFLLDTKVERLPKLPRRLRK